jgi:hypothetical protein
MVSCTEVELDELDVVGSGCVEEQGVIVRLDEALEGSEKVARVGNGKVDVLGVEVEGQMNSVVNRD